MITILAIPITFFTNEIAEIINRSTYTITNHALKPHPTFLASCYTFCKDIVLPPHKDVSTMIPLIYVHFIAH